MCPPSTRMVAPLTQSVRGTRRRAPVSLGSVKRRVLAVVIAVPWALWALVRTLGLDGGHPVVGAMAYTPYVAASSPLPVVAALLLRSRVAAAAAAVAAAALVLAIAPR